MNNIEKIYQSYGPVMEEFTEDVIKACYENIYQEMENFIKSYFLEENLKVDDIALTHAVLDYYTDVSRLKKLHNIKQINTTKVYAYESYWLLRRHPIQILKNPDNEEKVVFANEKFVFSRISQFLLNENMEMNIAEENKKSILNYFDTFYYYLKFRDYNPQIFEMLILSFNAGVLVGKNVIKKNIK